MATETKTYGSTEAAIDIDHQRQAEMIYAHLLRLSGDMRRNGSGGDAERQALSHIVTACSDVRRAIRALHEWTGVTPYQA